MDLRRELEGLHRASYGWAMSCCRDQRQEAEDVLQTVYIKVLEGRARFDGRSSFRTWLFSVIHRTAHEWRRRRWLHASLLDRWQVSALGELPGNESPPYEADPDRKLGRAVEGLSGRQREVLHLVFYQELTVEEAAQALGISLGSARTHFERGKQRLRTLLREDKTP
jgi:RNA polymerase sigma factor (sigma-70 family)